MTFSKFDSDAKALDRYFQKGEAKARAQLEARVSGGRAPADDLKLLRAICKHMSDRGCSDRASALLAGQK